MTSFLIGMSGFLVCLGLYLLSSLRSKPRKSVHVGRLRSVVIRKPVVITMGYADRIVSFSPFEERQVAKQKIEVTDLQLSLEEINAKLEALDEQRGYWANIFKLRTGARYLTPATIKAKGGGKPSESSGPTLPGMGDAPEAPTEPVTKADLTPAESSPTVKEPESEAAPSIPMGSGEEKSEHRKHKQQRA